MHEVPSPDDPPWVVAWQTAWGDASSLKAEKNYLRLIPAEPRLDQAGPPWHLGGVTTESVEPRLGLPISVEGWLWPRRSPSGGPGLCVDATWLLGGLPMVALGSLRLDSNSVTRVASYAQALSGGLADAAAWLGERNPDVLLSWAYGPDAHLRHIAATSPWCPDAGRVAVFLSGELAPSPVTPWRSGRPLARHDLAVHVAMHISAKARAQQRLIFAS